MPLCPPTAPSHLHLIHEDPPAERGDDEELLSVSRRGRPRGNGQSFLTVTSPAGPGCLYSSVCAPVPARGEPRSVFSCRGSRQSEEKDERVAPRGAEKSRTSKRTEAVGLRETDAGGSALTSSPLQISKI